MEGMWAMMVISETGGPGFVRLDASSSVERFNLLCVGDEEEEFVAAASIAASPEAAETDWAFLLLDGDKPSAVSRSNLEKLGPVVPLSVGWRPAYEHTGWKKLTEQGQQDGTALWTWLFERLDFS